MRRRAHDVARRAAELALSQVEEDRDPAGAAVGGGQVEVAVAVQVAGRDREGPRLHGIGESVRESDERGEIALIGDGVPVAVLARPGGDVACVGDAVLVAVRQPPGGDVARIRHAVAVAILGCAGSDVAGVGDAVVVQILPQVEFGVGGVVVGNIGPAAGPVSQRGVLPDVPARVDGHGLAGID